MTTKAALPSGGVLQSPVPFYLADEMECLVTADGVGRDEKRKCLAAIQVRQTVKVAALVAALKDAKAMLDKLGNFEGMQQVGKTTRYSRIIEALKNAAQ